MFKKMRWIQSLLIMFIFLHGCEVVAIPRGSFDIEYSDYYGLVLNQRYANLLSPSSALGFEIGFGGLEFRLNGTLEKIIECRHQVKLTADYLSQQSLFTFLTGPTGLWGIQHTLAAGYSYLFQSPKWVSLNLIGYQLHSRTDNLSTIWGANDNVRVLYRSLKGADGYGIAAGVTITPLVATWINLNLYYDTLGYRNEYADAQYKEGTGIGLQVIQVIHPRLALEINADHRAIYESYSGKISWLIPLKCTQVELSMTGQLIRGDLPEPKETRLGMMLTYRWDQSLSDANYLHSYSLQEGVVAGASRPMVRMPQTMVKVDEKIVN